jgi:type IV pilus assembly protein PilC
MAIFIWKTASSQGEITATTKSLAMAMLRRQQIHPKKIYQKQRWRLYFLTKKIKKKRIVTLLKQLHTLLDANIDLISALTLIKTSTKDPTIKSLLHTIFLGIEKGYTLSDMLSRYPHYFSPFTCQLLSIGEASGTLVKQLNRLIEYQQKRHSLKQKIKKTLTYPALVLITAITITAGLLIYVVPQFQNTYQNAGATLPLLTRLLIDFSNALQNYFLTIILVIATGSFSLFLLAKKHAGSRKKIDRLLLYMPLVKKTILIQNCQTLSTTLSAGIPILSALKMLLKTNKNILYHGAFQRLLNNVTQGAPLSTCFNNTFLFPLLFQQLIVSAENTGTLSDTLSNIANIYSKEVDDFVQQLDQFLEPFIILLLGGIIGTIVIALYLPIFHLGQTV